ncbi:hypothetical protein DES40_0522 [Litorimonas taeanensis]|uniref:Transposase n=1 Tax=Litorimonas taeanensis TaxID=568099 RepID=A0A420WJT5_9PROT|nr:DUF2274 domain-containing protein [Litorimonas taeanensis]RKQ71209.1 hypothetical protein DES40_0522 [Litorimonas taeanensis]
MSHPKIKLQKLPDTKPTKHTISVMPYLEADLEAYAKVYEKAYGEKADITALIPSMLASFLASDAGFKKAKRELA